MSHNSYSNVSYVRILQLPAVIPKTRKLLLMLSDVVEEAGRITDSALVFCYSYF